MKIKKKMGSPSPSVRPSVHHFNENKKLIDDVTGFKICTNQWWWTRTLHIHYRHEWVFIKRLTVNEQSISIWELDKQKEEIHSLNRKKKFCILICWVYFLQGSSLETIQRIVTVAKRRKLVRGCRAVEKLNLWRLPSCTLTLGLGVPSAWLWTVRLA